MENYSLIWEIFYDLSEETQQKLLNSANNLREAALADEPNDLINAADSRQKLSLGEAMYVIFETVRYLEGKDIKR